MKHNKKHYSEKWPSSKKLGSGLNNNTCHLLEHATADKITIYQILKENMHKNKTMTTAVSKKL